MNWKRILGIAAIIVAILCIISIQHQEIERLRDERNKYERNTETLLSDVQTYKVRDSLNAAKVSGLELTIKEYERFRSEDAALIKEMTAKNRDLVAVNKTQAQTIINLQAIPKDTVIITKDSVVVPAVTVHCGDRWFDFDGLLTETEFTGTLINRDSLVLAETVRYKRFLGFLWKTGKIKDRQLDAVSKNPHTTIEDIEHIVLEK